MAHSLEYPVLPVEDGIAVRLLPPAMFMYGAGTNMDSLVRGKLRSH